MNDTWWKLWDFVVIKTSVKDTVVIKTSVKDTVELRVSEKNWIIYGGEELAIEKPESNFFARISEIDHQGR